MYAKDPANHWKAKDAAIYLVTSLAAKKQTAKHGTTETSQLVNLADFFNNNIAHDLQSASVDEHPVLKADAIKYVITFRSVLPRNILLACIPCLVNLLQSKSNVVHSYAASCLERMFTLRNPGGGPPITSAELRTVKETMLKNLFAATELPGSHENEYIMKAIMRSICVLQEGCLPYAGYIVTQLTSKLAAVSKNPSKPQFNHYLFEAICALTRALSKGTKEDISKFEIALFPVIEEILRNDVTEFLPYIFQVLSLLLEIREGGIEGPHVSFFPLLLQPVLWERIGNIPALTRLLQAYIKRGSKQIVADNKLLSLLGVFQKLIASKANDHEGFYLLGSIVEHMEWSALEGHFKQIMIILFQRLQNSKTTKYVKGFLVFVSLLAGKKSAETLISLIDSVQPKLFGMVLEKLFVPDLQKVSGTTERKIYAVGVAKILTEAPIMLGEDYIQFWVHLLKALIGLFELPEDDSIPDDEHFIEIEDTPDRWVSGWWMCRCNTEGDVKTGYQTAFSQLMFAGKKEVDPFQEIADPKEFLAKQLYKLSIAHPGKLTPLISRGLEPKAAEFLQTYLHKAQVSLA